MYVDSSLMPADARIWIYQANRKLSEQEISSISGRAKEFLETWTAHDNALRASFQLHYGYFLIIMIDKNYEQASGCSIDKSFHFIQKLEKEFNLTLLDRMLFAYKTKDTVRVSPKKEFSTMYSNGTLNDDTIVFNNMVETKGDLYKKWEVPMRESWHKSVIGN
jgi:hypothetical protein